MSTPTPAKFTVPVKNGRPAVNKPLVAQKAPTETAHDRTSENLEKSTQMLKKISLLIYHTSHLLELGLAILLTLALLISVLQLAPSLYTMLFHSGTEGFTHFLEDAFTLVVGVEALKMLCKHTPGSALEVLLFAMARSIVVHHSNVVFVITGIGCITVVFIIRKFLYVHDFDTVPEEGSIFADVDPEEHLFGGHDDDPGPVAHQHQSIPNSLHIKRSLRDKNTPNYSSEMGEDEYPPVNVQPR